MRILVDARSLAEARGGVSRVTLRLITAYAQSYPGDELVLATTGRKKPALPEGLTALPNITRVHIGWPNKLWSAACLFRLVSLVTAAEKMAGKTDTLFLPNIGFSGRWPKDRKTVLLLHDLSFLIEPRWFKQKQQWWHRLVGAEGSIRRATRLLAVSETTKRDATKILGVDPESISVIPIGNTLMTEPSQPDLGIKRGDSPSRYCLALGLGDPRKNSRTAIEAIRALRKEKGYEDVGLILICSGIKNNVISSSSRNLPIGRSLRGACPVWNYGSRDDNFLKIFSSPTDDELASLYAHAAAFLYPSWYEGYGLPLHEAASFGTPCVAALAGALPETAPKGTLFAHPAKPQHWVEAIKIATHLQKNRIEPDGTAWIKAAELLHAACEN